MLSMRSTLISAALLVVSSTQAQASELSYSYLEFSTSHVDTPSFIYEDTQKYSLNGSISFANRFYGLASYHRTQFKLKEPWFCRAQAGVFCFGDNTVDEYNAGIGLRHGIADKTDLFIDGSFSTIGIDAANDYEQSYSGYTLRTGIRAVLTNRFEGSVTFLYREFDVLQDDFTVSLATQLKIDEAWGLTAQIENIGNRSNFGFGVRASF